MVPMTLYPSRLSTVVLFLACTTFTCVGVWMASRGETIGYFCAAFFGLGIPVALVQMIPGSAFLRIAPTGLTIASLFRENRMEWSELDEFFVLRQGARKLVGFNYSASSERTRAARFVASALAGCEGALPDTYGMKAEDLAALLNSALAEARAEGLVQSM